MTERRFTDKPDLAPQDVISLPADHPAMIENRTLFPSTVVTVTETVPDRLLVSGKENRKLGATVAKGHFKGYALFQLSLEERATCPTDCSLRNVCYGSSMQFARRHRIGDADVFFDRLGFELAELVDTHVGILVRLHVLGDFPSAEYVSFWKEALDEYPTLAVYGYTHRKPITPLGGGDEIGDAILVAKQVHPTRFRIRWSRDDVVRDGSHVIDYVPNNPTVNGNIVCPAQTDVTACCASCGLCWEASAREKAILFIKHGRQSSTLAAANATAAADAIADEVPASEEVEFPGKLRPVQAISLPKKLPVARIVGDYPIFKDVPISKMVIDTSYQRDLTSQSMKLIQAIAANWDWRHYKAPSCTELEDGTVHLIDGQHTAIAALTRGIKELPCMLITAREMATRANSFVAVNRDRLAVSRLQIFHASIIAKDVNATAILKCALMEDCTIPRTLPLKGTAKPGEILAITAVERTFQQKGLKVLGRIFRIGKRSELQMTSTVIYALSHIYGDMLFSTIAALTDDQIASGMRSIRDFEGEAQLRGSETGQNRYRAGAFVIAESCGVSLMEAA